MTKAKIYISKVWHDGLQAYDGFYDYQFEEVQEFIIYTSGSYLLQIIDWILDVSGKHKARHLFSSKCPKSISYGAKT